mmetsp:Transcript_6647/g.7644  ORF Transcript_6647/g.7644 Transcript_6647/m.7644 type:complete len:312 (+) Transcript_6647:73-1008(+)
MLDQARHTSRSQPCKNMEHAFFNVPEEEYFECNSDSENTRSFNGMEAAWCENTILDLEEAYFYEENQFRSKKGKINRKLRKGGNRRRKKSNPRQIIFSSPNCENKKEKTNSRSKKTKSKERRRQIARRDEHLAQLRARKENIQERVGPLIRAIDYTACYSYDYMSDHEYDEILPAKHEILPAKDLGLNGGGDYERLLQILEGDEITPEDYEILLLLDTNNKKSTLSDDLLKEFPILVIGENHEDRIPRADINGSRCEICIESWADMEDGTELRRLPCGHTFCKDCIDHWLKEVSTKCPNLSCYWSKECSDH